MKSINVRDSHGMIWRVRVSLALKQCEAEHSRAEE